MESGSSVSPEKSTVGRISMEVLNEMCTAVGAGILGIYILLKHGYETNSYFRTAIAATITTGCLYYFFRTSDREKPNKKKVVFISGCDSGLGFSLAQHTAKLGFTVVAGFLNLQSKGAQKIRDAYGDKIIQIELDLTSSNSIHLSHEYVERLIFANSGYEFYALINNSAVMVFGEFEWQTENLIQSQIEVNLTGTLKLTKVFCSLLRRHKGRIITVSSHCSQATLPGLAVYGATKTALRGWSDALRLEMNKYGVNVIQLIPGNFINQCSILSKHSQHVYEMHEAFTPDQHNFYGEYFKRYHAYLSAISRPVEPQMISCSKLYRVFEDSLLDVNPSTIYKCETLRYGFYHLLFKFSPVAVRDYLVMKFMQMPEYSSKYESLEIAG